MTNNKNKADLTALAIFFPSVLALAIIPILMQGTIIITDRLETYRYFTGTPNEMTGEYYLVDIYSQCKALAVVIFAVIMLVLALFGCVYLFKRTEKRRLVYVGASVVYVLLSLISALGSKYGDVAFFGQFDRAEGFFTTACYFVLFLFTMYAFRQTNNFRYIMLALFFCTGVNVIIGIFQFVGNSLIAQEWFRTLIIDPRYADMLVFNESGITGTMFGALYNYNYVGSFCGMVVPLFSVMALFSPKLWQKILCAVFDVMAMFLLFGSSARSGIVAVAAAVVLGIVIFARVIARRIKLVGIIAASVIVVFVGANFALGGALFERIPSLLSDITDFIAPAEGEKDLFSTLPVREITHNKDGTISFVSQTDTLTVGFDNDSFAYNISDSNGNGVNYVKNNTRVSFDDERFKGFSLDFLSSDGNPFYDDTIVMRFDGKENTFLMFRLFNERYIHLIDDKTYERLEPVNAEAIGFEGKEKLGSSRGYIWSRTFPLLENCLLVGYGPDTFVYNFPQNDFLAKYYSYNEGFNITVDKAHNLYIQIFYSSGLIALLAFLAICVFYIADSLRLYAFRREYRTGQICGAAVMLAIVGYLAAGIFNDSVVSVAPVFWILLGTGAALNTLNRREDRELAAAQTAQDAPSEAEELPAEKRQSVPSEDEEMRLKAQQLAQSIRASSNGRSQPRQRVSHEDVSALLEQVRAIKPSGSAKPKEDSGGKNDNGDND